jgi:hypothetical protein
VSPEPQPVAPEVVAALAAAVAVAMEGRPGRVVAVRPPAPPAWGSGERWRLAARLAAQRGGTVR